MPSERSDIVVLQGGWSAERDISLQSGAAAAQALETLGYQVRVLDVDRNIAQTLAQHKPDIAFNALHGSGGEDGQVQGILECLQIPYTHSGVLASALGMDKPRAKRLFAQAGLPVLPEQICADITQLTKHPMPPPYVVKPCQEGSSIDVLIVHADGAPPAAQWRKMQRANRSDPARLGGWMVEPYIAGMELSCAIMDGQALDVMELVPKDGFYDYANKYEDNRTAHILPARLPDEMLAMIKAHAEAAHSALGCRGISRVDFRYDHAPKGRGLFILELNTQPGLTALSLVPEMAAAHGIAFPQLMRWIVEDASCLR